MSTKTVAVSPAREPGRPRNVELDHKVLQAVRELLAEEGYQRLSVNKVTQRCGVHVRTINRRWDTKVEMVADAVFGGDDPVSERGGDFPTGRLEPDLRELIRRNLDYLSDPAVSSAMPALLTEVATNAKAQELMVSREREWEATINLLLKRAVDSGDAPKRALERGHILPMMLGSVTFLSRFQPWAFSAETLVNELANFVVIALRAS